MKLARVVALLMVVCACRKTTTVPAVGERHLLPGFSLALPGGEPLENKMTYPEGNYSVGVKGDWVVMVSWGTGTLTAGERKTYNDSWKLELDHPLTFQVPKLSSETFAGTNHAPARVTFVMCGQRHVVIASLDHVDVDKLHAAVLSTFTCSPDPTKEHAGGARLAVADRAGWARIGDHPNVVMLARDGGNEVLMGLYYPTEPDRATLEKLVSKYQATVGDGDPHPITSTVARGWMRTLHCGADNWMVVLYVESGTGAADRANIDGARCLRADEPDVAWPPAPAELQRLAE